IQDRATDIATAIQRLSVLGIGNPLRSGAVDQLAQNTTRLLTRLTETHVVLREGRKADGAASLAVNDRDLQAVSSLIGAMRRDERRLAVQRLKSAGQLSRQRRVVFVALSVTTTLFVVLLGWSLLRSTVRRLLVIQDNVQRFAGDLDLTPPIPASDEIGQIDKAVHEMVGTMRAQRRDNDMFIYSVSHDLRSPLVNLQGFSKELARSTQALREAVNTAGMAVDARQSIQRITTEEMPEALHYIDLAVQRQARIIESLLSLSRAGRVEYRRTRVDLDECVRALVSQIQHRDGMSHVEILVGKLPPVHGDRDALERLFDNLLVNAINYLSKERPGKVEIGCTEATASSVVVFVRDNGVGIAKEHIERVFMPFSRFAGGQGEGIGLSLVRRVVDRHHGSVWIESEPSLGTTVFVSLPADAVGTMT
ncbi:MAG: HAMP domain-containing sensor histidine kinase, partial [Planctomycetota bacterium]